MRHQNGQMFQDFERPFFRNGRPYRYARWRNLRDLYELSKNYYFATLVQKKLRIQQPLNFRWVVVMIWRNVSMNYECFFQINSTTKASKLKHMPWNCDRRQLVHGG